ncbi:MAG: hypothetical protein QOG54_1149 [Actinomycetota bacterium]|jgi:endonuclease/exonuclease/phosphatase family metal-dependent hydrolase|nr:hypothetical protein [Actinomycetota bacterium]
MQALTVATFNIHHGEGPDGVIDLQRTAEAIIETGAEIVALQELDRGLLRSGEVDQPAILAELTGMAVSFFPTLDRAGGEYGIALASFKPLDPSFVPLPRVGNEEPRGALVVRADGTWIVATHLATQRAARILQTTALADITSRLEGEMTVLGDFNQTRRTLTPLVEIGLKPVGPHLVTHRGRLKGRQIDHIVVSSGLRATEVFTVEAAASDHIPLVARLT